MPLLGQLSRSLSSVVSAVMVSPQPTWLALASPPVTARTTAIAATTATADTPSDGRARRPISLDVMATGETYSCCDQKVRRRDGGGGIASAVRGAEGRCRK